MSRYRIRSSFLNFDKYFDSIEEIVAYVNAHYEGISLKADELHHHFVDNNLPFFGVKGIIITKEAVRQEINVNRGEQPGEMQ